MKKILLATTILGMSAGYAAADVSFKGSAMVGFGQNGTEYGGKSNKDVGKDLTTTYTVGAGADSVPGTSDDTVVSVKTANTADDQLEFYSSFKLSVSGSAETDSGITFGGSSSILAGTSYNFADDKAFELGAGTLGNPTLFIGGAFGKVQFKTNGFTELQDDNNEKYDLDYSGTFDALTVGLRSDLNTVAGNKNYNPGTAGLSSVSVGYAIADMKLGLAYDEFGGEWGVSASKAFGPVTATLSASGDKVNDTVTKVKVAYAADAISASLAVASDDSWDVTAGYTAAGLTLGVKTNEADEWTVTGAYDLGGGLSLEAGSNYTEDMYFGAAMKF